MIRQGVRDQVGIAMPLTLIVLVILSALMIAFAVLAQSEPVIAMNQYRGAVARALAESGVERAVWALTAGSRVAAASIPLRAVSWRARPTRAARPSPSAR